MTIRRKIALVGPSFFSYIDAIRSTLEGRGFESQFYDERHSNSIPAKILYRIGYYNIISAAKSRHLNELAERILKGAFEAVVLIDVEVCDFDFVKKLTNRGVRVYLYMWDSARNKPTYLSYLAILHGKSSFDPDDCAKYGLVYIPLFAEDVFSSRHNGFPASNEPRLDVSFCGTLHSNRAKRIAELIDFASAKPLHLGLLLYFHSRGLLLIKSLVRISNVRFLRSVSTKGFSKQEIYALFSQSRYVFDIPHPGQVGLTARTFEALRSGTRLITFNERALSLLPSSFKSRVFRIESVGDLRKLDFDNPSPNAPLTEEEDYYLSLDRFVDQILALIDMRGGTVS